jgi:5'(3')-deoxyribonucleotidase
MRIGVDIDGILADFNSAYITRVIAWCGRDLFPPRPFEIPCWEYPQFYGYSNEEIKEVWKGIKADPHFWESLPPYNYTIDVLFYLRKCGVRGDDVYFITDRPGIDAKGQTERWLAQLDEYGGRGVVHPTVLISAEKGWIARGLKLDVYIDDKLENCEKVVAESPDTRVFLYTQGWNKSREVPGAIRTDRVIGFADPVAV